MRREDRRTSMHKTDAAGSFDIAVSLGLYCQSRHNISRVLWERRTHRAEQGEDFDLNGKTTEDYDFGSFAFDWCISNPAGIRKCLAKDFEGMFELENLTIANHPELKPSARDAFSGFFYPHAFSRPREGRLTLQRVAAQYDLAREKHDHVIGKTRKLLNSDLNILFVFSGTVGPKVLANLIGSLDARTRNYRILYCGWADDRQIIDVDAEEFGGRLISRPIEHLPHPGDPASWDRAFEGLEILPPAGQSGAVSANRAKLDSQCSPT